MAIPFSYLNLCRPKDYNGKALISFIQRKYDGLRVLVTKADGEIHAVTREGKTDFWPDLAAIEHIAAPIHRMADNTALDCELHCPERQATDIKTLVAAHSDLLVLTPFALPWFNAAPMREVRQEFINEALGELGFHPPFIEMLYPTPTAVSTELWQQRANSLGYEGWVAKEAHYSGWWKIKPYKTIDCIVLGTTISTSDSFYGGLKAIRVGVIDVASKKLTEVASVGSGFEADYRMSVNKATLLGRVCEVGYDSVASQGQLKFPRFIRWRDDKMAEECTSAQLL